MSFYDMIPDQLMIVPISGTRGGSGPALQGQPDRNEVWVLRGDVHTPYRARHIYPDAQKQAAVLLQLEVPVRLGQGKPRTKERRKHEDAGGKD